MAGILPPKPTMPTPPSDLTDPNANAKFQQEMLSYQEASSMYNFILKSMQDQINEESTTRAGLQDAHHKAIEQIISKLS